MLRLPTTSGKPPAPEETTPCMSELSKLPMEGVGVSPDSRSLDPVTKWSGQRYRDPKRDCQREKSGFLGLCGDLSKRTGAFVLNDTGNTDKH